MQASAAVFIVFIFLMMSYQNFKCHYLVVGTVKSSTLYSARNVLDLEILVVFLLISAFIKKCSDFCSTKVFLLDISEGPFVNFDF